VADANLVLPENQIIRHRDGSPALFANRFRYELQRRGLGTWIDADLYLLRPLPETEYLFGLEDEATINNSVLRLPPDSPIIPPLLAIFEQQVVPNWLPWRERLKASLRLKFTGTLDLGKLPWGVAGPKALTALALQHGLHDLAMPADVFSPVHWTKASWITDAETRLADVITPETVGVHLWNERIKGFKYQPAPAGSFLWRLQNESAQAL
jgi:hypothetical protein